MKFSLSFLFLTLIHLSFAQYTPGTVDFGTNGYVEYFPGDLPIIISAPHGGDLEPASIPDRSCSGCVTVKDSWTMEVAKELDSAIQAVFGGHPHIIINRLHRKKLDANREIVEAALGDPAAETAWYEYHDYVQIAKNECVANFGSAIYIDMHAHGHPIQRIELGYLITKSELENTDPMLNILNFQNESSIKHLTNVLNPSASFSEILRGSDCMGEYLENRGYPSVPSASDPAPAPSDPYFNGGYNTARHGSRDSSAINGIQFELNYTGIRNTNANRHNFARALACVLRSYLDQWYFDLDTWDPGNIVTTNSDTGPGSLRSALLGASDGDEITFDASLMGDTILLESELQICSDVVITGLGFESLYLSGGDATRLMRIMPGSHAQITDMTLMNGKCPVGEDGGAVRVEGELELTQCEVKNNFAEDDGGAINVSDSALLILDSCSVYQNSCGDDGGAIRCFGGTIHMTNSSIFDNSSPSFGGAISAIGTIDIDQCTFSGNTANGKGGAIRHFGDSLDLLTLSNSTFSENITGNDGGAISASCPLMMEFCTVVNNQASVDGGGLEMNDVPPTIQNSLIALNSAPNGADLLATNVNVPSSGYNFIGDTTGSSWIPAVGDLLGNSQTPIDPLVGTLSNNGGNTNTISLNAASACIDAANPNQYLTKDQRGLNRPSGIRADIGAFELCQSSFSIDSIQACESVSWIDGTTYFVDTSGVTFTLQNTNGCDSIVTLELEIQEIDTTVSNVNNTLSTSQLGASYQWIACDSSFQSIQNATMSDYSPTSNGLYAVIIEVNGCVDTSECIEVSTLNVLDLNQNNGISIYPNPSNGTVNVRFEETKNAFSIKIFTVLGEELSESDYFNQQEVQVELPQSKGIYYIEILTNELWYQRTKIIRN